MRRCEGKRVVFLAATVICVFITSSGSPAALAQTVQNPANETSDGASRKDDGMDRLIDTMNRLVEKRNAHALQLRSLKDETDRQQRSGEFPPIEEELEELVVLESDCRGEHAGCLAVVHLCGLASSYSGTERPVHRALDKVLEHLHEYGPLREVVLGFERLVAHDGMKTLHALTSVIDSKQTSPFVRESARLCRARWQLEMVAKREVSESVLESLSVAADIARVKEYLKANFPSVEEAEKWKRVAISELDELAAASTEHHLIVAKAVDPKGFVLTEDSERTNQSPSIAGVAKGLSFRAKHLAVGSECPKLEVKLVNGDNWGLREQNGRLVVVQFSFNGCGPCERMYPVLRDLVRDYPNKVSVVSVMADADVATTQEAVTTGKMTWSVTWDGQSGPIATEWGVRNFPTVFIFGTDRKLLFSGSIPEEYLAEIVKAFLTQDVKLRLRRTNACTGAAVARGSRNQRQLPPPRDAGRSTGIDSRPLGGYTFGMKTAVSIPDDVFEDAERLASRLRTSRSQLYARALAEFVARHDDDRVTSLMDQAVREAGGEADAFVQAAAQQSLQRVEW